EEDATGWQRFAFRQLFRPLGSEPTIVPDDFHRRLIAAWPEVVVGDAAVGADIRIDRAGGPRFDAERFLEVEGPAGGIQVVATEVAQVGAAKRPEVPPGHGEIRRVKWARLARPKPQVPVQAGGDRRRLLRAAS